MKPTNFSFPIRLVVKDSKSEAEKLGTDYEIEQKASLFETFINKPYNLNISASNTIKRSSETHKIE